MRPIALLIVLFASCGLLHAQVQERKLIDRILQPDMSLSNAMQNKAFYSGGGSFDTKNANVKDFYFTQKFSPKAYDTKQFDARSFWGGDFQFATKPATVKVDAAAEKTYETKSAQVKDARESGKDYYTAKGAYQTREAVERGKTSQARLDEMYKGKSQLNMDQVRDLLNKNH